MSEKKNLRKTGGDYEKIAGEYLCGLGYDILQYNFRSRYAEIDIVALDGDVLVFCEVKYRKTRISTHALEAVNSQKQWRISQAALFYLSKHQISGRQCRFDVIGITDKEITLIKNAFDYAGV